MSDNLRKPEYPVGQCEVGVVHIGVGAFHRAHQAQYFDDLLHTPSGRKWGIAGVNLLPQGQELLAALAARNNRYVLKTITPEGNCSYREIACLLELADHVSKPEHAEQLLARQGVELVTMTITEAGYLLDEHGNLEANGTAGDNQANTSVYAYLRAGLNLRRKADGGPITLLSCDNLRDNGKFLKSGLTQYLQACGDDELLIWLAANASFPCCMVDRITPAPIPEHAKDVQEQFGIDVDATVMAESFIQWVIEDEFAGKRPPLEEFGVEFITDVRPYEEAKVRMLNGSHTATSYLAALRNIDFVDQAVTDTELGAFFDDFVGDEAAVAIGEGGPVDLHEYQKDIKHRFSNPHLRDTIARICRHGCAKIQIFILPTVAALYAKGLAPRRSLEVIASWYLFMREVAAGKIAFAYDEPQWEKLTPLLEVGQEQAFASDSHLWGSLLDDYPQFATDLVAAINQLPA